MAINPRNKCRVVYAVMDDGCVSVSSGENAESLHVKLNLQVFGSHKLSPDLVYDVKRIKWINT